MNTASCVSIAPIIEPTVGTTAELDRLGDEIAELSAQLDAATARLLDLIREFDARAGWNTGFRSCAEWLSWRVGLDRGAARERVRVARAPKTFLQERLAPTFQRSLPRWRSNRRTRWPSSPKRHFTTESIPAPRASATRSWSTSTRRCWRTRMRPGSRSSTTARTFARKHPSVWRATRAGW